MKSECSERQAGLAKCLALGEDSEDTGPRCYGITPSCKCNMRATQTRVSQGDGEGRGALTQSLLYLPVPCQAGRNNFKVDAPNTSSLQIKKLAQREGGSE